jgi:hypothetical protein
MLPFELELMVDVLVQGFCSNVCRVDLPTYLGVFRCGMLMSYSFPSFFPDHVPYFSRLYFSLFQTLTSTSLDDCIRSARGLGG